MVDRIGTEGGGVGGGGGFADGTLFREEGGSGSLSGFSPRGTGGGTLGEDALSTRLMAVEALRRRYSCSFWRSRS